MLSTKSGSRWLLSGFVLAALGFPALRADNTISAVPGTLNYVEGRVYLGGQPLNSKAVGSAQIGQDQLLQTENGKAEILLTPGVFLRLGDNSELRMVTPNLTNTRVELVRGEAMIEVADLFKDNNIQVLDSGASVKLEQHGLYEFAAGASPQVAVFDGKADVLAGDQHLTLKKGKKAFLKEAKLRAESFDRNRHNELYAWSNLRSEYEAQASIQSAQTVVVNGGGWWGPGWYWNPWWGMYGFIPGNGILYSPFGWGFYSPGFIGYAPVYYGRPVYGIRPAVRGGFAAPHAVVGGHVATGFRSGISAGGFHGGSFGGRR